MKKAIRMQSIKQFRNAIYNITKAARFDGFDENEEPIYNLNILPILKAQGTVKLHGTNASVCYNAEDGLWVQSKKNIITPEKDNAGFAFFVESKRLSFIELCQIAFTNSAIDHNNNTATIYGEWAGTGIQKNVGISQVEKSFYIFGIKISPFDDEQDSYWVDSHLFDLSKEKHIYHIKDFETFEVEIDYNTPLLSNNKMVAMVDNVEKECPVARQLGFFGIGEGIVFETSYKNKIYRWKMKGEKHAGKSKVKKAQKVDDKKLQAIIDVVEKVTPEWRLEQMYQETFDTLNGGKGDIKKTGDYLRLVIKDILKEDIDIISGAGLTPKDINSSIARKSKRWLMKKLDEESILK
jgi:hypothetical protein